MLTVLDWGLGHATRCMPLIDALQQHGATVMLAGSGASLQLLQQQYPALQHFELTPYNPHYPADTNMVWAMAGQLPKFMKAIRAEQQETEEIVQREKIDIVISDNRYGCHTAQAQCYIITHQLNILMPPGWQWMERMVNRFNHAQLRNFTGVWCPANNAAFPQALLRGSNELNATFIGFLSRMQPMPSARQYAITAICSGPEPQRGLLQEALTKQLSALNAPAMLVGGKVEKTQKVKEKGSLTIVNYMNSEELNKLIAASAVIIARPGYSTVMDLMRTGSPAIFIPTPGQTEQTYIAAELMQQGIAYTMPQAELNVQKALKECNNYAGFGRFAGTNDLLTQAINNIL